MQETVILLYYKYVRIDRPKDIMIQQRALCRELGIKGRILIGEEGINGTIEGLPESIEKYCDFMNGHRIFKGISWKRSSGNGNAFPKLVVKVRKEIVTSGLGEQDIDPNEITGKYLSAEELDQWFEQGQKFKIIDMRNDYEHAVGHFEGSILPKMGNFRELKYAVQELTNLKGEKILTVCTGGVRCEKASGYLIQQGFKDVYQLKDGIVTYMEKFPNKHFKGKLYVFDNRIVMGFNTDAPEHEIIGRCWCCGGKSENYVNCYNVDCHKHFICCENCLIGGKPFCKLECQNVIKEKNKQNA